MTNAQKKIVRTLRRLEQDWPNDGTMIMANGNFLYLCTKHPEGGGKVLESFDIPSDGGDPDWTGGDEQTVEKRLPRFRPPRPEITSTRYSDTGIQPPPSFTDKES